MCFIDLWQGGVVDGWFFSGFPLSNGRGSIRFRAGLAHGIGVTKGGRNTKFHAVCDEKGRPHVLLLTPGNTHDAKVAILTINAVPPLDFLVADKGHDSNALRSWLIERGTTPVIPSMSNRKVQIEHDRQIYRQRNVVEMFCRFKDWRRAATHFDRNIKTFMATIAIAAFVTWWI
ncbi:MAG: IS5 family transposase [Sphingomonadaceae bacterium]